MTELLQDALRKVATTLPREEQDAIASQILETPEDETAWKEKLARRTNCAASPAKPDRTRARRDSSS